MKSIRISHLAAFAALALAASSVEAQTLTFTVETSTATGRDVTPRLTWTSSPAGATCSVPAPGAPNWSGNKPPTGTELLPAITATQSYSLTCAWPSNLTALVRWTGPTQNTDGSPYTNPGGFRVVYGQSASNLDQSARITDPAAASWQSPPLAAGTWNFGVIVVNSNGVESDLSNIATKVLTAGASQTRNLEVVVKFPNPATEVRAE